VYQLRGPNNKERLVPRIITRIIRSDSITVELLFGKDYTTNPNLIAVFRVTGAHSAEEGEGCVMKVLCTSGPGNSNSMWKSDNDVTVRRIK
ncbi:MAG: hypothetical protein ACRD8U_20655, partial [Pyrinomonadaceae bacterium]